MAVPAKRDVVAKHAGGKDDDGEEGEGVGGHDLVRRRARSSPRLGNGGPGEGRLGLDQHVLVLGEEPEGFGLELASAVVSGWRHLTMVL